MAKRRQGFNPPDGYTKGAEAAYRSVASGYRLWPELLELDDAFDLWEALESYFAGLWWVKDLTILQWQAAVDTARVTLGLEALPRKGANVAVIGEIHDREQRNVARLIRRLEGPEAL